MLNISCCTDIRGGVEPLTYDLFWQLVRAERTKSLIEEIRNGNLDKKRELPAITWQASYADGKRHDVSAVPSGLFMLDVDHVDDPKGLWLGIADRKQQLGIILSHITPSGHGLRVVALCQPQFDTIAENQRWLAGEIGTEFDAVCKDWARLSFLCCEEDILYIKEDFLDIEPLRVLDKVEAAQKEFEAGAKAIDGMYNIEDSLPSPSSVGNGNCLPSVGSKPDSLASVNAPFALATEREYNPDLRFGNILYKDIVDEFMRREFGGQPKVGARHAALMTMCKFFSYICEFDPGMLIQVLPPLKPKKEIEDIIRDTLAWQSKNARKAPMIPRKLWLLIKELEAKQGIEESAITDEMEIEEDEIAADPIPVCPPGIQEFVECAPRSHRPAVILTSLAMWGTLATRVRGIYQQQITEEEMEQLIADFGEKKARRMKPVEYMNSTSFMVAVIAEQGDGKGFSTRMNKYLMAKLKAEGDEFDEMISNWKPKDGKSDEANVQQPLIPKRVIMANSTTPDMLKKMMASAETHLFIFSPEIDTLLHGMGAVIRERVDMFRESFDNDNYGQGRATKAGVSGDSDVYINLVANGTPERVMAFYGPNAKNGLVGRTIFVRLPSRKGKRDALFLEMDARQRRIVDSQIDRLMAETRTVDFDEEKGTFNVNLLPEIVYRLPWLDKAMYDWEGEQLDVVVMDVDDARDVFRKRAKVIGYRAGLLAWHLWHKNTQKVREACMEFARYVANRVLESQKDQFGDLVTTSAPTLSVAARPKTVQEAIFNQLPNVFTNNTLSDVLIKNGKRTPSREVLYLWRMKNLVFTLRKTNYKVGSKEYEELMESSLTPRPLRTERELIEEDEEDAEPQQLDLFD